ncbi:MAG: hypothetical protein SNJ67_08245, partial [Chloracidobacterium sp.]
MRSFAPLMAVLAGWLTLSTCVLLPEVTANPQTIVTAAQVNGTWRRKDGSALKVLALGRQRLRVAFDGVYAYRLPDGTPTANIGTGDGIAFIEGDTATFNPMGDDDPECQITLRFTGGRLVVTQDGVC